MTEHRRKRLDTARVPVVTGTERDVGKLVALAVLVGGVTLALFWSATRHGFVNLDDDLYVYQNAQVAGGLNLAGLRYAFTTTDGGSWMPLTWISLLLDGALWGNAPAGFHATNVLLHALAAALLCLALGKMTGQFWPSTLAAALFALHPLRVESVVWIAERKDVLSVAFFMLTVVAYARYAAKPSAPRMAATSTCLVLGLMAKPMLITAPVLLLLLDVWPLRRLEIGWAALKNRLPALLVEKLPLFLAGAIFSILTLLTQSAAGAVLADAESGFARVGRIGDNYLFYLGKILWPHALNVLYPVTPLNWGRAGLGLAIIVGGSLALIRWGRGRPWLAVGWCWFLVALFPVSGVVPIGSTWVADRYTYLPSVGLAVMLAWTLWSGAARTRWGGSVVSGVSVCLVTLLALVTFGNLPRWQNSQTLFADAVRKGGHPGAYLNLGVALADEGQFTLAVEHFTQALELDPRSAEAYYNRANAWQALTETERALADYARAIELKPEHGMAYNNRGTLHVARGELGMALADFTQAIEISPHYAEALGNRARTYLEMGRYAEAVTDYSKVITSRPDFAPAYHDRAVAYFHLRDYEQAWADIRACRKLGLSPQAELIRRLEAESGRRE